MLRSFTAIANNGIMLEPKFISALYNPNTDTARVSSKEEVEIQFQNKLPMIHFAI